MKKSSDGPRRVILPLAVLGVSALAASAMVIMRPQVETQRPTVKPPLVRTEVVALGAKTMQVESQGTVNPRTESQLVPEVSGRVTWVAPSFVSGGFFEAGDVLVRIDPFDYEQALVAARAEVARSSVLLERERAEAELARTEWQELGRGAGSPLMLREPQIAEAQAIVEAAGANLQRAKRNLERTVVRAPYAGRVREKRVDVGQYISVGAPVATLYSVDVAEVRLPLPDDELQYLDLPLVYRGDSDDDGPNVTLTATFAGGTHEWEGRVVRTEGEIDPRSRMVHVVAQVENPYGRGDEPGRPPLAVGMYVRARIHGRTIEDVAILPRTALRPDGNVWVVDADGRLRIRSVAVLRTDREHVYISSGLSEGERVCVSALEVVSEGMRVRVAGAPDA